MRINEVLFTDIFSPKEYKNFILPPRIMDQFKKGVYTHLMFHGNQGIGKSAFMKFLSSKHPNLYINAARDGALELLRTKVPRFCDEIPLNFGEYDSDIKIIMLDEIGRKATEGFYEGLKGVMDEYKNVRFIATTNYPQNLPDSLKSRFEMVNFGFNNSKERDDVYTGYTNRMKNIITSIGMGITPDVLKTLVDLNFTDFRGALQTIQRLKISEIKDITLDKLMVASFDMIDLYDLILSGNIDSPENIHKELMGQYANSAIDVLNSLNGDFIRYITKEKISYATIIPEAVILIAKYSDMMGRIDPALSMKACVFELMLLTNRKFGKPVEKG